MIKQVIVLRKDLNMRKGKMIAQGAHASMKVILDMMEQTKEYQMPFGKKMLTKELQYFQDDPLHEWLDGTFTKVVLYVNSEQELLTIFMEAFEKELNCAIIRDAGKTEFNGVLTYTAVAIGPNDSEDIDKITGDLKLL